MRLIDWVSDTWMHEADIRRRTVATRSNFLCHCVSNDAYWRVSGGELVAEDLSTGTAVVPAAGKGESLPAPTYMAITQRATVYSDLICINFRPSSSATKPARTRCATG